MRGQRFPLAVLWGTGTSLLITLRRAKASGVLLTLGELSAAVPLLGSEDPGHRNTISLLRWPSRPGSVSPESRIGQSRDVCPALGQMLRTSLPWWLGPREEMGGG